MKRRCSARAGYFAPTQCLWRCGKSSEAVRAASRTSSAAAHLVAAAPRSPAALQARSGTSSSRLQAITPPGWRQRRRAAAAVAGVVTAGTTAGATVPLARPCAPYPLRLIQHDEARSAGAAQLHAGGAVHPVGPPARLPHRPAQVVVPARRPQRHVCHVSRCVCRCCFERPIQQHCSEGR